MRDPQRRADKAPLLQPGADPAQSRKVAGENRGAGSVECADADGGLVGDKCGGLRGTGPGRQHPAALGQLLHKGAADGHEPCRVRQVERLGDDGRGELADAVPDDRRGPHPELHQRAGQRVLHGEENGLSGAGPVDGRVPGEDRLVDGGDGVRLQGFGSLFEEGPVDGGLFVQPGGHPRVLGALSGEREGQHGFFVGRCGFGVCGLQLRPGEQPGGEFLGSVGGGGEAVRQCGAGAVAGPAEPGEFGAGAVRDIDGLEPQIAAQGPRGVGGQREHPDVRAGFDGGCRRLRGRREDHMGVGAAHAEAGDARPAAVGGQRERLVDQFHGAAGQPEPRILLTAPRTAGHDSVPQRQHGLDQSGDPGRALGVPDRALDRADGQGPLPYAVFVAEHVTERQHFDLVAERCARAVRLDEANLVGRDRGPAAGGGDHLALGCAVRRHDAVAAAVLVDGAAEDDRVDGVAVAYRVLEQAQRHHAHALAAPDAVGSFGERLAPAVGGGEPGLGVDLVEDRANDDIDAAGERQVALAGAQCGAGEVHGDQGGGARGVHGEAWAAQIELVGDAVGEHGAAAAGAGPRGDPVGRGEAEPHPVVGHGAHIGAHRAARQTRRGDPGVLDGPPGALEQQPLLRIHGFRVGGGHGEEGTVEGVGVGQEATGQGRGAA